MPGTPGRSSAGTTTSDPNLYRYNANKRRRHPVDPPNWTRPLPSTIYEQSGVSNKLGLADKSPASTLTAHSDDISMAVGTDCGIYNQEDNAEKWFDDSNKNVSSNRNLAFHDCECRRMHRSIYDR